MTGQNIARDPRTVARYIPGVLDALFPHLAQGFVTSINRRAKSLPQLKAVSLELVRASALQRAMLFEVAVAAAEQLIDQSEPVDWELCLKVAVSRQRQHYDAVVPYGLSEADKDVSLKVAKNLFAMLKEFQSQAPNTELVRSPRIPGYQWIASGVGDFSVGQTLIEVKCVNKHFSSSDYRQMLMYWLLTYCGALEGNQPEWLSGVLVNPRLNLFVKFPFDDIIAIASGGRSKVELVEQLSAILADRGLGPAV